MTLEDFKEIHADDSPIRKLDLLLETMGNWRNDAVNRTDAKWRWNDEEVSYWDNEVKHMMNRSFWLYSELSNALASREPHVLTLEEAQGEDEVWFEFRPSNVGRYADCYMHDTGDRTRVYFTGKAVMSLFENTDYGKTWRCWDKRPTDAQREATPWENTPSIIPE